MWERVTAIGTVILIVLTLVLISQGPAIGWLHWPGFMLPLIVVCGLVIAAILNFRTAKLHAGTDKETDAPKVPYWCDEIAADDAQNMGDRVFWLWDQPQQFFGSDDPYITFMVTFINATIFRLTSGRVEGETFYGTTPLRDAPKIVNQQKLLPLILNHGAHASVLLRQPLSREVAFRLNEQKGHVALDFSKVWIDFKVERQSGVTAPDVFRLYGSGDVTVANRN